MKNLILIICCLLAGAANAQKQIKAYVTSNTVQIKNIEPDSVNYSDLEIIGNAIGNAKVVMLGEQDHGDAPTFLAKTRLIKYLHEKKGFNVLAFESDFFALNDGWDKLKKDKAHTDPFLKTNIYPIWTVCSACSPLFYNYVPATIATANPLIITGFDSQQYLNYAHLNLAKAVDSILRLNNAAIAKQANYKTQILPLVDSCVKWPLHPPKDSVIINTCLGYLHTIQNQLTATMDKDNYWLFVVDNMVQQITGVKDVLLTGKVQNASNQRDIQMAKNLKWLNEVKFKDQKIIVWAADAHVVKSLSSMKQSFFTKQVAMGDVFTNYLKNNDKVYILGFASANGMAGRLGSKPYKLFLRGNGFETWINDKYQYAFVDFDAYNLQYPTANEYFNATILGHFNHESKWNQVVDGVFFIRDMYTCEPLNNH